MSVPQVIAINNSGQAVVADKRYADKKNVVGFAVESATATNPIKIQKIANYAKFPSGHLTAGLPYYLGDSGAVISDTNLILDTEHKVFIGYAISDTILDIQLHTHMDETTDVKTIRNFQFKYDSTEDALRFNFV